MNSLSRVITFALVSIVLLSACHSVPKHARFIPKDAIAVVGVNMDGISKKVAWSAITGSKLLDDMKEAAKNQQGKDAIGDLEHMGLDWSSTIYFYAKPDKRFDKDAKMSVIAPLKDAQQWEAFVKKVYPTAVITKVKDRSEVMLDGKAYAAWTNDLLMIMNTMVQKVAHKEVAATDSTATNEEDMAAATWEENVPDSLATVNEMEASFNLKEEASIRDNSRFTKMEKEGHDITVFVGYDALMNSYKMKDMGMMGMNMAGTMWKNSAMTTGIDFEKGRVTAEMLYYASDSMKPVAKEFGKDNIDKDMLARIPGQNLNLVAGYHLAPNAVKMILDKMGFSGMANMFLMQQGMTVDDILGAFTGDMVVALNNFKVTQAAVDTALAAADAYKPKMDFVYAMRINSKASFDKVFGLVNKEGMLRQTAPNTYALPGMDSISLVISDKYLAVSNIAANAQAFIQKESGNIPEVASKEVAGHPLGMYVDVQSMLANAAPMMHLSGRDSLLGMEMRNMFSNATANGGEYKGEANEYHMTINFVNKEENALLQFLHLAQRVSQAKKQGAVASN